MTIEHFSQVNFNPTGILSAQACTSGFLILWSLYGVARGCHSTIIVKMGCNNGNCLQPVTRKMQMARALAILSALLPVLERVAGAQIIPGGMGTRVNGSAIGVCDSGRCTIQGGVMAGSNLYHRFSVFDTRKGIDEIRVDTRNKANLIFGVTGSLGSFLDKPLRFSLPANLFFFSPGGIWIGSGAAFNNVRNLVLSIGMSRDLARSFTGPYRVDSSHLHNLAESPPLDIDNHQNLNSATASTYFTGSGSILLEGGLLSIDRSLLINAGKGSVKSTGNSQMTINAGDNVQIFGHDISLQDVHISAGHRESLGAIDIRAVTSPDSSRNGVVQLEKTKLVGQDLRVSGRSVEIKKSDLRASDGGIVIQTTLPSGQGNQIAVIDSILDVSGDGIFSSTQWMKKIGQNPRHIVLLADGPIAIEKSLLEASQSSRQSDASRAMDDSLIPFASVATGGIILIKSNQNISLEKSRIVADAERSRAGEVLLIVDGQDQAKGIVINRSRISASNGMGGGNLTLQSSAGIKLDASELVANSDRFPLVNGSRFGRDRLDQNSGVWPFTFEGGQINLVNLSTTNGIVIRNSSLFAFQSTSGGGLEADQLEYNQGDLFGRLNGKPIFGIGYAYDFAGGRIRLGSRGGIQIESNSIIDASSKNRGQTLENIAGEISIINSGSLPVRIADSFMAAQSAGSHDVSNRDHKGGSLIIWNNGSVRLHNSSVDVSADNHRFLGKENILPNIDIASFAKLSFTGFNWLDAMYNQVLEPNYYSIYLYGRNFHIPLDPRRLQIVAPALPSIEAPSDRDLLVSNYNGLVNLFLGQAIQSLGADVSFGLKSFHDGVRSAANPLVLMTVDSDSYFSSSPQANSDITINLTPSDSGSAFLDAQQRSLDNTLKSLGLGKERARLRSIPELQERLAQASQRASSPKPPAIPGAVQPLAPLSSSLATPPYRPAILNLRRDDQPEGQTKISLILLTARGEPISKSVLLPRARLDGWIRGVQRQLSRREEPRSDAGRDPSRLLVQALLEPLLPELRQQGITALLLEADRGLQAIPYAALPLGGRPLGDAFALTITPSLGLIDLEPARPVPPAADHPMLLAGASDFRNGLEPLPMVRQELSALAAEHPAIALLNEAFTPAALIDKARANSVRQLHIATHANFLPGQASNGVLYTATSSLNLADLGRGLRSRAEASPLDLITLSACLTALGDERSELGFIGMALQAGARSGLGTLWEVDDAASAAFFIQFYRHLKQGLTKDQALQATRQAFLRGQVRLQGDRLVGPDPAAGNKPTTLVRGLPREQQTLFAQGLDHPYYWAGMVLSGSPW